MIAASTDYWFVPEVPLELLSSFYARWYYWSDGYRDQWDSLGIPPQDGVNEPTFAEVELLRPDAETESGVALPAWEDPFPVIGGGQLIEAPLTTYLLAEGDAFTTDPFENWFAKFQAKVAWKMYILTLSDQARKLLVFRSRS